MSNICKCFGKEKWFVETSFPGVRRAKRDTFRIDKEIFKGKSKFQDIYIFESPGFGKMLVLDGIIQLSQSDEFVYHEMIVHEPFMTHPNPKRVLVIGGGDGGVLREAVKYPGIQIDFVEIDCQVVDVCRKYLPFISKGAFSNKKVNVLFCDGLKFIAGKKDCYDVIIVDSTDPVGPGKVLFQMNFYKKVYNALKKDGIAVFQLGPFLDFDLIIRGIGRNLGRLFKFVNPFRLPMPSYSCGCEYCFMMASKTVDPAKVTTATVAQRVRQRLGAQENKLKYYTPAIHTASLVMPKLWQL